MKQAGILRHIEAFFSSGLEPVLADSSIQYIHRQAIAEFLISNSRVHVSVFQKLMYAFIAGGVGLALVFMVSITGIHHGKTSQSLDTITFSLEEL